VKLEFRRLNAGETDFELIFGTLFPISFALLLVWLKLTLPLPGCWFRRITGLPCLTCGGTHSLRALMNMNWLQALHWNPLCSTAIFAMACLAACSLVTVIFGLPRLRIARMDARSAFFLRMLLAAGIAGNWIYVIATQAGR